MKGRKNECAAVRLDKSRLIAAMAIIAMAFVVLAAVPAALTDSDATTTVPTKPTVDPEGSGPGSDQKLGKDTLYNITSAISNVTFSVQTEGQEYLVWLNIASGALKNTAAITGTLTVGKGVTLVINDERTDIRNGETFRNVTLTIDGGTVFFNHVSGGNGQFFCGGSISMTGGAKLVMNCNGISPDTLTMSGSSQLLWESVSDKSEACKNINNLPSMTVGGSSGNNTSTIEAGSSITICDAARLQVNSDNTSAKIELSGTIDGSYHAYGTAAALTIKDGGVLDGKIFTKKDSDYTYAQVKLTGSGAGLSITNSSGVMTLTGHVEGTDDEIKTLNGSKLTFSGTAGSVVKNITVGSSGLTVDAGELTIGQGTTVIVTDSATLSVSSGATLGIEGTLKNSDDSKKVTISGNGSIAVGAEADISAVETADTVKVVVDPSKMSEMTVSGETSSTSTTYTAIQTVTVSKYWTLVSGATVVVEGKLVVPEGTVLTIQKNAKLILKSGATAEIEGSVVIESKDSTDAETVLDGILAVGDKSTLKIEGSVVAEGKLQAGNGSTVTIEQDAVLTIEDDGVLAVGSSTEDGTAAAIVVKASGTLVLNGDIDDSAVILDYGTVMIDSDVAISDNQEVRLMADGAVVDVVKFTVDAYPTIATLKITDAGLQALSYRESGETKYVTIGTPAEADEITVTPSQTGATVGSAGKAYLSFTGLTATVSVSSKALDTHKDNSDANSAKGIYNDKQYSKTMAVSGSFDVSIGKIDSTDSTDLTNAVAKATVQLDNGYASFSKVSIKVSGEVSVADNVTLDNATGKLSVSGSIVAGSDKAVFSNAATVEVTGEISVVKNKISNETGVSAARYETSAKDTSGSTVKTYHYVSIDAAIAVADGADVEEIVAIGTTTVKETAGIAAGVTLTGQSGATVKIGSSTSTGVVLTVEEGAAVKGSFTEITVYGTLYAENRKNIGVTSAVVSDVYSEEIGEDGKAVKDGWAQWTNLASAIASGVDTITISKASGNVDIKSNLTIPSDVTVIVPEGKASLKLYDGVTLTIDGVLRTSMDIIAEHRFAVNALDIGGTAESSAVVVNGMLMVADSLSMTIGSGSGSSTSFLSGAPVYGAYYTVQDWKVVTTIDQALTETDITSAAITVYGPVVGSDGTVTANDTFKGITVSAAEFTPVNNGTEVGTSLTMASLTLGKGTSITMTGPYTGSVVVGENSVQFTDVSGTIKAANSSDSLVLTGSATLDYTKALTVSAGTVSLGSSTAAFDYVDSDSYSPMYIASGATAKAVNVTDIDNLSVSGTLEVPAGKTLTVGTLTVYGSVSTAASTETTAAGSLTVGTAYVGITSYDFYEYTGASASVTGPLSVTKMFVVSGATVDQDLSAYKKTEVYNNGSLWFTAYGKDSNQTMNLNKAPLSNAVLSGWATSEGGDVKYKTTDSIYIGSYSKLYSVVDTQIYTVIIKADEGIDNIYLDGDLMSYGLYIDRDASGDTSAVYYAYTAVVSAGTYKVTCTLKNGYSGEAKLALVDSEGSTASVSGMGFTVSGDEGDAILQLTGIEKSGYVDPVEPVQPKDDDGLKVTDYLLIVLVILVVILAVIVAMRLMRS